MNTFDLALDLDKRAGVTQWVTLRQGDHNGTVLKATIYDHGVQVGGGYTCRVSIRHPGTGETYYRETANYSNGVATVTIDEQYAAAIVGITSGYFELLQGSAVIASTEDFGVRILRSATDGAVPGEKYDSAIEDALAELDEATGRISQMVVDATEEYLEAHPEITTTVQDNSLTDAKLVQRGGILSRVERLWYRLANLLTATPAESDVLTVSDAAKTPLAGLSLYGRSTQDGTPTPDAPVPIESVTPNLYQQTMFAAGTTHSTVGITYVVNDDGTCTCSGTATAFAWLWGGGGGADDRYFVLLPAGTYTVCGSHAVVAQKKVDGTVSSITSTSYRAATFTIEEPTLIKAVPVIPNGYTADNEVAWVAVYAGAGWHPYVPYGHAGMWARGRNLFDPTTLMLTTAEYYSEADGGAIEVLMSDDRTWGQIGSIPIVGGETYTISRSDATGRVDYRFYAANWESVTSGGNVADGVKVASVTTPSNARYMKFKVGVGADKSSYPLATTVQLERGSTATPYQPYAESVIPIDLQGHVLRSLPDGTRDEVTVDEYGRATLVQRVGSYTVTGSESSISDTAQMANGIYRLRANNVLSPVAPTNSGRALCTHAPVNPVWASATVHIYVTGNSLYLYATASSAAEVLAAYAGAEVIYALATPQTIDLGTIDPVALQGPDMTAQAVPTAPFELTYERDLNVTLARLEASIAEVATA